MAISNATIAQQLADAQARAQASPAPAKAALVSDARDYIEALVTLQRPFNAEGICLKPNGQFVFEGVLVAPPYSGLAAILTASRTVNDLVRLNAALQAALTQ